MNLPELTQEQRDAIFAEEMKKKEAQEVNLQQDRKACKVLICETADNVGKDLFEAFKNLSIAKQKAYEAVADVIEMKVELYGEKRKQQSHSLTGRDYRLVVGRNATDSHDDTMDDGILKCEEFVKTLIKKETQKETVIILTELLKGGEGKKMDSRRILELTKFANEFNNPQFTDGVKIIQEAYEKALTSYYIKLEKKNALGGWKNCPLSISGAPFPEGYTTRLFAEDDN